LPRWPTGALPARRVFFAYGGRRTSAWTRCLRHWPLFNLARVGSRAFASLGPSTSATTSSFTAILQQIPPPWCRMTVGWGRVRRHSRTYVSLLPQATEGRIVFWAITGGQCVAAVVICITYVAGRCDGVANSRPSPGGGVSIWAWGGENRPAETIGGEQQDETATDLNNDLRAQRAAGHACCRRACCCALFTMRIGKDTRSIWLTSSLLPGGEGRGVASSCRRDRLVANGLRSSSHLAFGTRGRRHPECLQRSAATLMFHQFWAVPAAVQIQNHHLLKNLGLIVLRHESRLGARALYSPDAGGRENRSPKNDKILKAPSLYRRWPKAIPGAGRGRRSIAIWRSVSASTMWRRRSALMRSFRGKCRGVDSTLQLRTRKKSMRTTVRRPSAPCQCRRSFVASGLQGFGRREMKMSRDDWPIAIIYQVSAGRSRVFLEAEDLALNHIKAPWLRSMAWRTSDAVAHAICDARGMSSKLR